MRVCVRAMRSDFLWLRSVRPHVRGGTRCAVRGRHITSTKVTALPEWLGQCKLLVTLCVPRPPPPPCAFAAVPALRCCAWRCRAGRWGRRHAALDAAAKALPVVGRRPSPARAWLARVADRRAVGGGPEPPGAAAQLARRDAGGTELAALPAAADWPNLMYL
jgi:hypothetical protein